MATIREVTIKEGNPVWLFGLIANPANAEPVVEADVVSIKVRVFEVATRATVRTQIGDDIDLDPADVISDTPVTTDLRYTEDEGYNFKFQLPGTSFPNGGKKYKVEVLFTCDGALPFLEVWSFKTVNTFFHDTGDVND